MTSDFEEKSDKVTKYDTDVIVDNSVEIGDFYDFCHFFAKSA
ncbi:MAG: hypothetical protein PUG54_00810 [Firmicutes bacterium]|nr:hypothetical protein [Bacillota bacterium]